MLHAVLVIVLVVRCVLNFPRSSRTSFPGNRLFLYSLRGRRTSSFPIVCASFVVAPLRVVLVERLAAVIVGIELVLVVRVVSLVLSASQRFPRVPRRFSHALILVRMVRFPPPDRSASFLLRWLLLLLLLFFRRRLSRRHP